MSFIRNLYCFIHLIVLFLFVLQRVVNASCEINSEAAKNEFFNNLLVMNAAIDRVKELYIQHLPDVVKAHINAACTILEEKLKHVLSTGEQIQEEVLIAKMVMDYGTDDETFHKINMWVRQWEEVLSQRLRNGLSLRENSPEPLYIYEEQKQYFNKLCTNLTQMCLKHDVPSFIDSTQKTDLRFDLDESIKNDILVQTVLGHLPFFDCSYKKENDEDSNFFFIDIGNVSNYLIIFKQSGTENAVEPFAVVNKTDIDFSVLNSL